MLALALVSFSAGVIVVALAGFLTGRLHGTSFTGLMAIANSLLGVGSALYHETVLLCVNASVVAICAWLWWHGGGGDGTKRRLRSWGRGFQGVRRTAPQAA